MRRAIELARQSIHTGGGPFAALVVDPRVAVPHEESAPAAPVVIATGQNRVVPHCDPTAHAEIVAIREACAKLERFSLEGYVLYTTCEPCPMCLAAIYWARLAVVYYAATQDDAAAAGFDDREFYEQLAKPLEARRLPMQQMLRDEAKQTFREWLDEPGRVAY